MVEMGRVLVQFGLSLPCSAENASNYVHGNVTILSLMAAYNAWRYPHTSQAQISDSGCLLLLLSIILWFPPYILKHCHLSNML